MFSTLARVALAGLCCLLGLAAGAAALPSSNPVTSYGLPWTYEIKWAAVVNIEDAPGTSWDARLAAAQTTVAAQGGGVVYFPGGLYEFKDSITLKNGVVLRGADPISITDARDERYTLPTRFEFPRYVPSFAGNGTPSDTAFKGIFVEDPATTSNCGVVNLAINRGHIFFADTDDHRAGRNRLVYGCLLRNAADVSKDVPAPFQHPWQRFPAWKQAAIHLYTAENALVANNRLPASGDENFLMQGYLVEGRGNDRKPVAPEDGVWFDYDNRGGVSVNHYIIGGIGGTPPDGTPETYPFGFRTGIVIRNNYIFCTGHSAIAFAGDGVICSFNIIRFKPEVPIWTNTGRGMVAGSSTNGNRAVEIRGWRWTLEGNDYEVYQNRVGNSKVHVNDGEGLMHEDHANSTILDSKLINNKGNSYLSLYKCAGINGLLVQGNDIRTRGGIAAIYVVANRNSGPFECKNVRIIDNTVAGSGIQITGQPGENNLVKGNHFIGEGGKIINDANAVVEENEGFQVVTPQAPAK